MEEQGGCETLVLVYQTARCHIPKDYNFSFDDREHVKVRLFLFLVVFAKCTGMFWFRREDNIKMESSGIGPEAV